MAKKKGPNKTRKNVKWGRGNSALGLRVGGSVFAVCAVANPRITRTSRQQVKAEMERNQQRGRPSGEKKCQHKGTRTGGGAKKKKDQRQKKTWVARKTIQRPQKRTKTGLTKPEKKVNTNQGQAGKKKRGGFNGKSRKRKKVVYDRRSKDQKGGLLRGENWVGGKRLLARSTPRWK